MKIIIIIIPNNLGKEIKKIMISRITSVLFKIFSTFNEIIGTNN